MSEAPRPRSESPLLPTLAAVTYLAMLVALWGVLSVILDRDVVDYPDAGILLGPTMAATATVVTWVVLLRMRRARTPWFAVIAAALLSFGGMLVVAALGYAPVAAAHFAISPFVLGGAGLAGLVVLGAWGIRPAARS